MAIVLKTGKPFFEPRTKANHMIAYGVIGRLEINKVVRHAAVSIDIFVSQDVKNEGETNARIGEIGSQFSGEAYDKYFAESILAEAGKTITSQAYVAMNEKLINGAKTPTDLIIDPEIWESDEPA